jgi:hypothetical protein
LVYHYQAFAANRRDGGSTNDIDISPADKKSDLGFRFSFPFDDANPTATITTGNHKKDNSNKDTITTCPDDSNFTEDGKCKTQPQPQPDDDCLFDPSLNK